MALSPPSMQPVAVGQCPSTFRLKSVHHKRCSPLAPGRGVRRLPENFHRHGSARDSSQLLGHPLALRSAPTRGSCFTLLVPAAPQRSGGAYVAQAQLGAQGSFDGLCVLLIEDDELGRAALTSLLASLPARAGQFAHDIERGPSVNCHLDSPSTTPCQRHNAVRTQRPGQRRCKSGN